MKLRKGQKKTPKTQPNKKTHQNQQTKNPTTTKKSRYLGNKSEGGKKRQRIKNKKKGFTSAEFLCMLPNICVTG